MMEKEVFKMAQEYFKEHLPDYQVWEVRKKSNHPSDSFLWMVSGFNQKTGKFAFWSSFNTSITGGSLNHGHYNLDESTVKDLFEEFYYDCLREEGE